MWPLRPLGEVSQPFLGLALNRQRPPEQGAHEVPVVSAKDLEDDALITGPLGTVLVDPAASYQRYRIEPGDVLLVARGATLRVALAPELHGALATSSLIVLRPGDALRGTVLAAYLRGPQGQAELRSRIRTSTTTQALNVKDVAALAVPIPDADTQHQIEALYLATEAAFLEGLAEARFRREMGSAVMNHLLFAGSEKGRAAAGGQP